MNFPDNYNFIYSKLTKITTHHSKWRATYQTRTKVYFKDKNKLSKHSETTSGFSERDECEKGIYKRIYIYIYIYSNSTKYTSTSTKLFT